MEINMSKVETYCGRRYRKGPGGMADAVVRILRRKQLRLITDTDTFLPMDQTVFAMGNLVKSAERLIE